VNCRWENLCPNANLGSTTPRRAQPVAADLRAIIPLPGMKESSRESSPERRFAHEPQIFRLVKWALHIQSSVATLPGQKPHPFRCCRGLRPSKRRLLATDNGFLEAAPRTLTELQVDAHAQGLCQGAEESEINRRVVSVAVLDLALKQLTLGPAFPQGPSREACAPCSSLSPQLIQCGLSAHSCEVVSTINAI